MGEKILIELDDSFSRAKCLDNPNKLYVFGENLKDRNASFPGGGQACIRTMENAYGFITKASVEEYLSDEHAENLAKLHLNQVMEIVALTTFNSDKNATENFFTPKYNTVVFPKYGLGTGRAAMQKECPKVFIEMCRVLYLWLGYNNLENMVVPNY